MSGQLLNVPGVYTITCLSSGRVYVGQARNIRKRWGSHRWHLARGAHRNAHLQRAWDKYGKEQFVFAIVADLSFAPADELQGALNAMEIRVLAATPRPYNLMEAAQSGVSPSAETRAKLSAQRLALWRNEDFRARRSLAHKAACASPELQKRRSVSLRAAFQAPDERARRSAVAKRRWAEGGDLREKQGDRRRANWQDPDYREKQAASRRATWDDPIVREKRLRGMEAAWVKRKARSEQKP